MATWKQHSSRVARQCTLLVMACCCLSMPLSAAESPVRDRDDPAAKVLFRLPDAVPPGASVGDVSPDGNVFLLSGTTDKGTTAAWLYERATARLQRVVPTKKPNEEAVLRRAMACIITFMALRGISEYLQAIGEMQKGIENILETDAIFEGVEAGRMIRAYIGQS